MMDIFRQYQYFAVGFSEHFTTSEGGDMSITNSNSNFGAVALNAKDSNQLRLLKITEDISHTLFHQRINSNKIYQLSGKL